MKEYPLSPRKRGERFGDMNVSGTCIESDSPAPRTWRSVLAWWGVIPVVAFLAMEVVYGWPRAVEGASSPEFAVSYLAGDVLGRLLMAYGISWIVYRAALRSRLAATIAFSLMMGLVSVGLLPKATSFEGFRFEIPARWTRVPPQRAKTKAMLALISGNPGSPNALLMVDVGKPASPDAMEIAKSLAGRDGSVLPQKVAVDHDEGIRIETPSVDLSRPRIAVVVMRQEKVYLIMAAAVEGTDISRAFEEVIKTWRWN